MSLLAMVEGQGLAGVLGICFLILGLATFVWGQWAWETHTKAGRVLLFLMSAALLSAGIMFLGVVNYLEHTWGI